MTLSSKSRLSGQKVAFTLIEVLISLALMAALLVSLGAAVSAALNSNAENEEIADVTQTARWILSRIAQDVRTAAAVDTTSTCITIIPPDDGSGTDQVEYEFTGGTLYQRVTVSGTETSYVLLGSSDEVSVTSFAVTTEIGEDYLGVECTKTVTVDMTLDCDGNSLTLTASSSPRRNQLF